MNSGMIGKVAKAHRYAEERGRFHIDQLQLRVQGDHSEHHVSMTEGRWRCSCEFFSFHDTCAHTMALELLLEGMLPKDQRAVA